VHFDYGAAKVNLRQPVDALRLKAAVIDLRQLTRQGQFDIAGELGILSI
jgi:hypothetical protein